MMANRSVIATCVLLVFITENSYGWNALGHKVVAEIAWQKLDPPSREAIVATLRHHPRFDADFSQRMNDELGRVGVDVQNNWIFCQAATWPDIARGSEFDRPRWHYINLPVFLSSAQATHFAGNLPANVSFDYPSPLNENMLNGVQAVKQSIDILTSSDSNQEEKALHYCWLLHVGGDLHQPFHTSALFTSRLFPGGDHGGNKILIRREGSSANPQKLHAIWDGLLGRRARFNDALGKAHQLIDDHPSEYNMPFVALPNDVWTTEGQQLALDHGYEALLDEIRQAESRSGGLGSIEVPDSYFAEAGALAGRQAVIAGVRMAGVLTAILNTSPAPRALAGQGRALGFPAAIARIPASRSTPVADRTFSGGNGDAALLDRIEQLERDVLELRTQLRLSADTFRGFPPQVHPSHQFVSEADDGAQCDCGEQE